MIGFLVAILSGALMSIQGVWNTEITNGTNMWISGVWIQVTALSTCACAWLIKSREPFDKLFKFQPHYMLLGGVLGAGITWTVIYSMEKLGPAKAALFIVIAQVTVAYVISVLGVFGVEKESISIRKIIGLLIAFVGTTIFQWK